MSAYAAASPPPGNYLETSYQKCTDYLYAVAHRFDEEARPGKRMRDKISYLSGLIYAGKHRFWYSPARDWFFAAPRQDQIKALKHSENYYKFLIKSNVKEYLKSAPSIRARATDPDNSMADDAARAADAVGLDFRRRFRTEAIRNVEYRRVQLDGCFAGFIDYNPAGGPSFEHPVFEDRIVPPSVAYGCYNCGDYGDLGAAQSGQPPQSPEEAGEGEPPTCPTCGSAALKITSVPPDVMQQQTGTMTVPMGDWIYRSVPMMELNVNASARDWSELSDVLWLRWKYGEHISKAHARWPALAGKIKAGAVGDSADFDRSLRFQKRLEQLAGGTQFDEWASSTMWRDTVHITQDWFQPVTYADYRNNTPNPEEIIEGSGIAVPPGGALTDLFPKGLRLICAGSIPVAIDDKQAVDHWSLGAFDPNPHGFWPSGTEDAIGLQLDYNELRSLLKTHTMCSSFPRTLVRSQYVKNFELASSPSQIINTQMHTPDSMALNDLIYPTPPTAVSQGAYEMLNYYREAMQYATGALNNFNGADANNANRTATQSSILEASALAHAEAVISGLGWFECRMSDLAVALWRKYSHFPRTYEVSGDYGMIETAALAKIDIPVEVRFFMEPGTALPERPYQIKDNIDQYISKLVEWMQASGGAPMPDDIKRELSSAYGISASMLEAKAAARKAENDLQALQQIAAQAPKLLQQIAAQKIQQIISTPIDPALVPNGAVAQLKQQAVQQFVQMLADPSTQAKLLLGWIAQTPGVPGKVRVQGDYPKEMYTFYRHYLNTDKGMRETELMTALIQGRQLELLDAWGKQQAKENEAQIAAQAPMIQMQQAQARQADAQQAQQQQAQLQGDMMKQAVHEEHHAENQSRLQRERAPRQGQGAQRDAYAARRGAQKDVRARQ